MSFTVVFYCRVYARLMPISVYGAIVILNQLAQLAYSFNGDTTILPYVVFSLIWEAFYVFGLLAYHGVRTVIKCL